MIKAGMRCRQNPVMELTVIFKRFCGEGFSQSNDVWVSHPSPGIHVCKRNFARYPIPFNSPQNIDVAIN